MHFKLNKSLVSVDWLNNHFNDENLIILNCTIPKVTAKKAVTISNEKQQIKGAVFFDIKSVFSNVNSPFPNTILGPKEFEQKAQDLGIYKNSTIICYDDLGIYSSPRVWWMFQLMGFQNIAVLNGGFPEWKKNNYPIENQIKNELSKGDFKVVYQPEKIKFTKDILEVIKDGKNLVIDARSEGRFLGTSQEPRKDVKSGHIPNSKSLPFTNIIKNGKMISQEKLEAFFENINPNKKDMIFSCGTGITAAILALGATLSNYKKYAVYDGSWTEWGSTASLPIEI